MRLNSALQQDLKSESNKIIIIYNLEKDFFF